ncbi:MAG: hypothetical protein H0T10_06020 [Actinobacteria bacterium]|nr:hypothetical protein [Actinomycetota bacterium]
MDTVVEQLKEIVQEQDRLAPFTVNCIRRESRREFLCLVEGRNPERDEVSITYDVVCSTRETCIFAPRNFGISD